MAPSSPLLSGLGTPYHPASCSAVQAEVEPAVEVDVGPQGRGNHADLFQARGERFGDVGEPAAVVAQEPA
jgi:hypothetical protein